MPIARPGAIPAELERRRFSFATEYYRLYAWSHLMLLSALGWVFPEPLSVSGRSLRRAELDQETLSRGDRASGPLGEGRFVGRHPTSGAPIIAWDTTSYEAMCVAFDEENARQIVAWRTLAERYAWSTDACARRALRTDRALLALVFLGTVLPGLFTLLTGQGVDQALMIVLLAAPTVGMLILLLVALSFLLITPTAALAAAIVGARAARVSRAAVVEDTEGRSSAAEVLATIQTSDDHSPARSIEKIDRSSRAKEINK